MEMSNINTDNPDHLAKIQLKTDNNDTIEIDNVKCYNNKLSGAVAKLFHQALKVESFDENGQNKVYYIKKDSLLLNTWQKLKDADFSTFFKKFNNSETIKIIPTEKSQQFASAIKALSQLIQNKELTLNQQSEIIEHAHTLQDLINLYPHLAKEIPEEIKINPNLAKFKL